MEEYYCEEDDETAASASDEDQEIIRAEASCDPSVGRLELRKLREEYLKKSRLRSTDSITLSQLEQIFIELLFMDQSQVHEEEKVRTTFLILANSTKVSLFVKEAKNLIFRHSSQSAEPYVKVLVTDLVSQSKTQRTTNICRCKGIEGWVWMEKLETFYLDKSARKFTVAVYDEDTTGLAGGQQHIPVHYDSYYLGSVDVDVSQGQESSSKYNLKGLALRVLRVLSAFRVLSALTQNTHPENTTTALASSTSIVDGCRVVSTESWFKLRFDRNLSCGKKPQEGHIELGEVLLLVETQHGKGLVHAQDDCEISFQDAVRILQTVLHNESDRKQHSHVCKPPRFPLDPDSFLKQSWDMLIILLLLFTTFAVPYLLAFGTEIDPHAPLDTFQIWDLALDVLFCIDIVLSFCTSFLRKGVYVTNMAVIAKSYLCGWFWIDMPGSVPFDKIIIYLSSSSNTQVSWQYLYLCTSKCVRGSVPFDKIIIYSSSSSKTQVSVFVLL
jgi:hypothetical protein